MNPAERTAWAFAILAAWGGYRLARAILSEFELAAWRDAWNAIPEDVRLTIRDTLMSEEGVTNGD